MNRSEEPGTNPQPDADEPNRDDRDEHDEAEERTEPARPLIDQDFAGSVNAALHDSDD
jgi:hypothetical protein